MSIKLRLDASNLAALRAGLAPVHQALLSLHCAERERLAGLPDDLLGYLEA